jgi:hypothetical protein
LRDTALSADDGVEENDRPEAAADTVEKRECEDLCSAAASRHFETLVGDAASSVYSDKSKFYPRIAEAYTITGTYSNTFRNSLAVDERPKAAVIQQNDFVAFF